MKKLRVMMAWTLDLLFGRDIEQMITLRDVEELSERWARIRAGRKAVTPIGSSEINAAVSRHRQGRVAMDTTILAQWPACFGSLVGGSATVATAWITQRTLNRRELLAAETSKRESLYGEFINECSARAVDSFENTSTNRKGYCRSTRC